MVNYFFATDRVIVKQWLIRAGLMVNSSMLMANSSDWWMLMIGSARPINGSLLLNERLTKGR